MGKPCISTELDTKYLFAGNVACSESVKQITRHPFSSRFAHRDLRVNKRETKKFTHTSFSMTAFRIKDEGHVLEQSATCKLVGANTRQTTRHQRRQTDNGGSGYYSDKSRSSPFSPLPPAPLPRPPPLPLSRIISGSPELKPNMTPIHLSQLLII